MTAPESTCEFISDRSGICGRKAHFTTQTPSVLMARTLAVCGIHRLVAQRRGWPTTGREPS